MMDKIKSIFKVLIIFVQRTLDIIHRYLFGIPMMNRCQITAHLFLGSQYSLVGLKKLKDLGITAIVNMRMHSVFDEAQYMGIKYLHLPTIDNTPPLIEDLIKGANFADEAIKKGGKVYIHCRQGLGRGPTMTIAYLIKTGITYDDAFALVQKIRPFIKPRPEQILRLKELEKFYRAQSTHP